MSDSATEPALRCRECSWITFPLNEDEAAELGWDRWDDATGWRIARAASAIHVALRHPGLLHRETGMDVEAQLGACAHHLGPYWFAVAQRIALMDTSDV
jgi:hypothetical protein